MRKAIVIGASSGIGRELAELFARENFQVGIVARRLSLLQELKARITNITHLEQIDITEVVSAQVKLADLITQMQGVDIVVICSGVGYQNPDLEWQLEDQTVTTNVTGFMAVANVAVKYFIKRQSGHLVGLSTIAALRGGSGSPAYNASKAFLSNYLEGLRQKVVQAGLPITITDIQPGFVNTEMAKGEGLFWVTSPQKAAAQIYTAIKKKKSHVYITRRWWLIAWLLRLMPDFIYLRLRF